MESFLFYLLRSSIAIAFFYLTYKAIFSKTSFHSWNRMLVIAILLFGVILPVFHIQLFPESKNEIELLNKFDKVYSSSNASVKMDNSSLHFSSDKILFIIYLIGFFAILFRQMIGYFQFFGMIHKSVKKKLPDGSILCINDRKIEPCSWFRWIIISNEDLESDDFGIIMRHEQTHFKYLHSADRLLFDCFTALFWFNPFVWLFCRELEIIHEYQADEKTLQMGIDHKEYQLLLIRKSVGENAFALANNFLQRDLHKRIKMMKTNKTRNSQKWEYLFLLPAMALIFTLLSFPVLNARNISNGTEIIRKSELKDVEQSLNIKKGNDSIRSKGKNATFHKTEKQNKVVVKKDSVVRASLYVVDGKITRSEDVNKINPDEIKSVSVLKGASAVSSYGKEGKDGVIVITTLKNESNSSNRPVKSILNVGDGNPLILMNGQPISKDEMNKIDPATIEAINVYKGEKAISLYGEKGKEGVIVITLKNSDK